MYNKRRYSECPYCSNINIDFQDDFFNKKTKKMIIKIIISLCVLFIVFITIYMKLNDLGCSFLNLKVFCIKDGTLTGYVGLKRNITIPSNSKEYGRGVNLKSVTVPGTVKK